MLVLLASAAIQAGAEHGDDFQHILCKLFLKTRLLSFVDDDHLDLLQLAKGKDQFATEPEQPVLVRDD